MLTPYFLLVDSLIHTINPPPSLSMEFLVKAQRALKTGDEALAKEAMLLKHKQAEATQDILLHVDTEKQPLARLNNTLIDYQYIQKPSKQPLITMPASIPRTAAMKFSYLPSGAGHAAVIDGWQNAFSKEVKNYESFAVYAETKLQEAIHHAYQNQGGDHSKVDPGIPAICVDLMLKMGDSAFGFRFAPLIKLLSTQLIRCIYNINGDPSSTISQDELDKVNIRWLFAQKPWVHSCAEVARERDRLKETVKAEVAGQHMKKVLNSRNAGITLMLNKQNLWTRKIIFRTWKNYHVNERARRNKFLRYQKARGSEERRTAGAKRQQMHYTVFLHN